MAELRPGTAFTRRLRGWLDRAAPATDGGDARAAPERASGETGTTEESQRRTFVRTPALLELEILTTTGAVVRGVGMDLSATGIRAKIGGSFAVGNRVRVTIRLPDDDPVDVIAEIVRRESASVAGLGFVELTHHDRDRIARYIASAQQRALARRKAETPLFGAGLLRRVSGSDADA
ncbi:MAG: PilZ domain-containing protein [Actinobacteria bacterium]|nr:PilZ domain-containing protein [Actinomycetota bacterium]